MSDAISREQLSDDPTPVDFRRANGAPMVVRLDDPTKWDRYSRPSGWGSDLDDESNLVTWKIDRAMEGVASDPSIAATVASHIGSGRRGQGTARACHPAGPRRGAADIGTALHRMTERVERGDGFRAPEPYARHRRVPHLPRRRRAVVRRDRVPAGQRRDAPPGRPTASLKAHRPLVVPGFDVVVPGQHILGDLKTGKKLDFSLPGFAIQLALYCDSVFYDIATNVRSPMPHNLRTDIALLVHMPAGQVNCELHWIDLQVGREGAEIVKRVRAWRKRDDFTQPFRYPPSDEEALLTTPMEQLVHGDFIPHDPDLQGIDTEAWVQAMSAWAQERINTIGTANEPRAMLLRQWPTNVPTLRQGGLTPAQLSAVLDLLDAIEGAYDLPFPAGDPRVEWDRGLHSDALLRNNEPRSNVP
jgi:hypothetical protein